MNSLFQLKRYIRPHLKLIIASILFAIPLSAIRASTPALIKYAIDDVFISKNFRKLLLFTAAIVGLYLANFVVRFLHFFLLRVVVFRVNQKLKTDLFEHLLGLSADYFTTQSTGTLISRVASDPQYVDNGLMCLNTIIREPLTFVFFLGYCLYLNWQLTIVTFLVFPPLIWVFRTSGRHLKRYIGKLTNENAALFSVLQESFTGIRIIKTFNLENHVIKKFDTRADRFAKVAMKISALEETAHPLVELLMALVASAIIYYGGTKVISGVIKPGELISLLVTFALMLNPIRNLTDVNIKFYQAAGACDRIFEVFRWKSHLSKPENPKRISQFVHKIELNQVSFAYPDAPERTILKEVSFVIPRGRTIALVGASGAGKSSLVSLLPRIFDPTHGSIRIDGIETRELAIEDLRKLIAVVSQDVFLFNDTVEENIRCGSLNATSQQIREATRLAHATEFIESLPQGFQTIIGDRGQKLSGGQRQRLSIARAFLRQAPILILDEATSSLDNASEQVVKTALEELMKNRTTLIIAHRLSTIQSADEILVMKDGRIIESGKHEDLLLRGGEYALFYSPSLTVE